MSTVMTEVQIIKHKFKPQYKLKHSKTRAEILSSLFAVQNTNQNNFNFGCG
jgi:hypothetical protein